MIIENKQVSSLYTYPPSPDDQEYFKKYVEQRTLSRQDLVVSALNTTLQCELLERNNRLVEGLECTRKYSTGNSSLILQHYFSPSLCIEHSCLQFSCQE